uniref:Retrotransposon gag domain-containing protein n=1 Tax=Tanacetum cinerariifolium TaxID=118510 RepID=A0A699GQ13_TANCI|nr:hypothetical protein [Tanacetum cinerariifolium]
MTPKKKNTRASPATTTTTTTPVTNAQVKAFIDQGIADVLEAHDTDRSMNGDDGHNSRTCSRRTEQTARECTYTDFLKCQPLNFKGTEGVVGLMQWFKKMETVFHINNCTVICQIKFATCTLQGIALTWWNSYVMTVTHDVAYAMTWKTLKKMMTDTYCPRGEMKNLDIEMWNFKVKDEIDKYVGGLPDMIHESVMASKPNTMHNAIEFSLELMDKKIRTLVERQAKNKRKVDNYNQAQQQLPKRRNVAQAYTAGTGQRKEYAGTLPLFNKWDYKSNYLELNNQNHGNQAKGTEACGMVYTLGGGEIDQDPNNIADEIEALKRKLLVPSCFVIFGLEPSSLSFDFFSSSKIFKSLSFCHDRLCCFAILCLDHYAHTFHHLESLLTISLDRLDILKEDLVYQSLQKSFSLCLSFLDSGILMLSMSL